MRPTALVIQRILSSEMSKFQLHTLDDEKITKSVDCVRHVLPLFGTASLYIYRQFYFEIKKKVLCLYIMAFKVFQKINSKLLAKKIGVKIVRNLIQFREKEQKKCVDKIKCFRLRKAGDGNMLESVHVCV